MSRGASPSILVVEHSREIGEPIVDQLTADGYRASLALTAEHARVLAGISSPMLVILGLLDSPRGALDLLAEIRGGGGSWRDDLPAIVVSSSAQRLDLLRAFEAGADDFLARPFGYLELRARLRALLRRTSGQQGRVHLQVGPLRVDPGAHAVRLHGHLVSLRRLEYELLLHLARDPTRVFAKPELLRDVWGYQAPCSTRTLDSHASRLRRKLAHPGERWVVNVRGVGYRLT